MAALAAGGIVELSSLMLLSAPGFFLQVPVLVLQLLPLLAESATAAMVRWWQRPHGQKVLVQLCWVIPSRQKYQQPALALKRLDGAQAKYKVDPEPLGPQHTHMHRPAVLSQRCCPE